MLELHAVKIAKAIHTKTKRLALDNLTRRDMRGIKSLEQRHAHADSLRRSAEETILHAKDLHQDALVDYSAKQSRIQEVRSAIKA